MNILRVLPTGDKTLQLPGDAREALSPALTPSVWAAALRVPRLGTCFCHPSAQHAPVSIQQFLGPAPALRENHRGSSETLTYA